MCFSNLPVEFDQEGNPYLADEAEDVDRPDGRTSEADRAGPAEIEADPERAYEAIVNSLPDGAQAHLVRGRGDPTPRPRAQTDSVDVGSD